MQKVLKNGQTALSIFYDFQREQNRIPTKDEFDLAFYGKELNRGASNYYYRVKKKFLEGEMND